MFSIETPYLKDFKEIFSGIAIPQIISKPLAFGCYQGLYRIHLPL
jgi:hypothetical protein